MQPVDAVDLSSVFICAAPLPIPETVTVDVETSLAAADTVKGCDVQIVRVGVERPRFAFAG